MTTYLVKAEDEAGNSMRFYEVDDENVAKELAKRIGEIYRNPKVVPKS